MMYFLLHKDLHILFTSELEFFSIWVLLLENFVEKNEGEWDFYSEAVMQSKFLKLWINAEQSFEKGISHFLC